MHAVFLKHFSLEGVPAERSVDHLVFQNRKIPIVDGVVQFTDDQSYSSGNFERLRRLHATLQLDSRNGTTDRNDTILARTGWPAEFFRGKTVLECGCGAGPDTEILLKLGAQVMAVDLAGLDVAHANLGDRPDLCLVQASIADLPLQPQSFDIVFCHRVIMHTPNPPATLDHILRFVKPGGAAFVHSYSRDAYQMLRWKYAMRPLTKRLPSERLYEAIKASSKVMFPLTKIFNKTRVGRRLSWHFLPFLNYAGNEKLAAMDETTLREYAVHETFDALSPPFDRPLSKREFAAAASRHLDRPWEIVSGSAITLLRTRADALEA